MLVLNSSTDTVYAFAKAKFARPAGRQVHDQKRNTVLKRTNPQYLFLITQETLFLD